jgi:hypothetical protein
MNKDTCFEKDSMNSSVSSAQSMLQWVHRFFLIGLFLFLGRQTALNFTTEWDFLAYHLPFSLMHYDLTTFQPGPFLMEAFKGFPPLVHLVQGWFIKTTGIMSAGSLANVLMLCLMIFCLKVLLQQKVRWFLTFCLAVPLFVIHYSSHYIDFWVAGSVLIAFASTVKIFKTGFSWKSGFSLLIGVFCGMYAKYQAWPFIVAMVFFIFVHRLYVEKARFFSSQSLAWTMASGILVLSFPIKNIVEFGNPTYPVPAPLVHVLFPKSPQAFSKEELKPIMPEYLWEASRPRRFLESAFELNRLRADNFSYNVDQGFQGGPTNPHFRMGGWFVPTVLGMLFGLTVIFVYIPAARLAISTLASFVLMLSVIPQNHELRYWLFIPLCGLYLIAQDMEFLSNRWQLGLKAFFLVCAIFVFNKTFDRYRVSKITPAELTPGVAREYWVRRANSQIAADECIKVDIPWGIFWAGPTFNEYPVQYCNSK